MENFKQKTEEELGNQLNRAEYYFGAKEMDPNFRSKLLSMSLDDIKQQHPEQYKAYLNFLKTENTISNFPDINIDDKKEKPKIYIFPTRTRGHAFKVSFQNEIHIIKPLQSSIEPSVAEKASQIGVGPKQYKSKEGYIHEEFVEGPLLLNLKKEECTPDFMKELGKKFARALNELHKQDVLVNDQILSDDFSNCHTIIDKKGDVRIIDFGVSIDLEDFPNLSDEAVRSLIITDPFMSWSFNYGSPEDQKNELKNYRENILPRFKSKKDLIKFKDYHLLQEGFYFLQQRLPNAQYFNEGVMEDLEKPENL